MNDRHQQTPFGVDGDTQVLRIVVRDRSGLGVDGCVQVGVLFERLDGRYVRQRRAGADHDAHADAAERRAIV